MGRRELTASGFDALDAQLVHTQILDEASDSKLLFS